MPCFSRKQKEKMARRGVKRCMKKEAPVRRIFAQSFPMLGARKRNTVRKVTVTAAVPMYLRVQIQLGMGPGRAVIAQRRAATAQRRLLWQVK